MNYNEEVFPQSRVFNPDRWLITDPVALKRSENTSAPFSKGARACLGMGLATAEIYIVLAAVVRRFRLERVGKGDLKVREIFGVIFDKPVEVKVTVVDA
jgi:cytochrome P450